MEPYSSIDEISLNISSDALVQRLGVPKEQKENRIGLEEFHFEGSIWRFGKDGHLNEVTVEAPKITIGGVESEFEELKMRIEIDDSEYFESYGFTVSPKNGIAFDPEHAPFLTILTQEGLQGWKEI